MFRPLGLLGCRPFSGSWPKQLAARKRRCFFFIGFSCFDRASFCLGASVCAQPVKRKHIRDLDIVALATAPHRTLKDVANRVREGNDGIDMYTEMSKHTCERLATIAAARLSSSDFTALKARLALLRTKKMKKALLKRTVDDLLEGVVCLPGHIAGDMVCACVCFCFEHMCARVS